uniref:Low affinity sulfate transporter n=1 Tax=Paulinella chromatophora TaxID=39717 RepID=B1X3E8_PAUCH|nr:low affinity sulfate transporter [Paulinella chromatophora]ACB42467.1 low affinity sulfate transporter [Paulinella chromatophora]|eukprot:gb/GEZN01004683.1/.p1 GENE.gb/GEZN01004683.1/~~gb/GEZN01004683.1/.p1  ORF type:complete len:548 (+),score=-40.55 gb/GEZN01004683.1/:114-1757(+)
MLKRISSQYFIGDLFGGITAAVIALPMALAFGIASGIGAAAGLWGAVIVGLVAALFGGTASLISEPTGPMTVMFTAVAANLTAETVNYDNGIAMAFTVVIIAGLFQIILGLCKLGRYITMMPYMVISGFMSGIGMILIILQIPSCLGQAMPAGGIIGILQSLPSLINQTRVPDAILALTTIVILWITPAKIKRICPPQLLALLTGTFLSLLVFKNTDIRTIGIIPGGFPNFIQPHVEFSHLRLMLIDGSILGMLGSIDALLTSVVADSLTRTEHNSNKELVGQGLGNIVSGLFGGLPGAGATMGTVVNIQAGGRTPLSGIIRALILMIVILGAGNLAAGIPLAVLSAIALKVGVDIVDWSFFLRAHHLSTKGAIIMYSVTAMTVLVDVMAAVGVGVFVANVLTIERMSTTQSKTVKTISTADGDVKLSNLEQNLLDEAEGKVLLFQLAGQMIFGVAKAINREHNAISYCKAVIFDVSEISHLGVTSSLALENAILEALEKNRQVFLVGARDFTLNRLKKLGLLECLPFHHIGNNRSNAIAAAVASLD